VTDERIAERVADSPAAQRAEQALAEGHEPEQADLNTLLNVLTTRNALRGCDCGHTSKHHKQTGRCRKDCVCDWAARKAERKRRSAGHV
jgi:hypothetical protein